MKLYIAEKPSLARAIADAIGNPEKKESFIACSGGDRVTWCFGHMMEQASPEAYGKQFAPPWSLDPLPVLPEVWRVLPVRESERVRNPEVNRKRRDSYRHFQALEKLLKDPSVTEIVNAGDPDREGQLIVDEILEHLGVRKPVRRIWLKALDPGTIRKAIREEADNALPKFRGLRNSALARARADWLVGMNMTRAITSLARSRTGDGTVWSIGRVQTPVMRLVHERNEEIARFRPKDFFVPVLTVETARKATVDLEWNTREIAGVTDEEKRILARTDAERIVQNARGKSFPLAVKKENKAVAPPRPWSLSALQVFAGKEYGLSPQKVLDVVQSLYDNGHVSYPRTDCEFLPESLHPEVAKILPFLESLFSVPAGLLNPKLKSKAFDDSKVTAHYAISPTVKIPSLNKLSGDERAIYGAIARVYLAQFAPPLELSETGILLDSGHDTFTATGKVVRSKGWTAIWPHGGPKNDRILPEVSDGEEGRVANGTVRTSQTTPPKPFTESGIIEVMKSVHKYVADPEARSILKESDGIGTEATRAGIVETLIARDLLGKASGKSKDPALLVTEKGRALLSSITREVSDPVLTAIWERTLSKIAESGTSPDPFVGEVGARVSKWISDLKECAGTIDMGNFLPVLFPCPSCGRPMNRIKGKAGFFWGCSGYRDTEKPCRTTCPDERGAPGTPRVSVPSPEEPTGLACKKCGKNLFRRLTGSGKPKPFLRCSSCSASFWPEGSGVGEEWPPMSAGSKSSKKSSSKGSGKAAPQGRGAFKTPAGRRTR